MMTCQLPMKFVMHPSSRLLAQQYFVPKGLFLMAIPVGLGNSNLFLSWHINQINALVGIKRFQWPEAYFDEMLVISRSTFSD